MNVLYFIKAPVFIYMIYIFVVLIKTVPSALPSIENKSLQINIKKPKKERLKKKKKGFPKLTKTDFFFFFLSAL